MGVWICMDKKNTFWHYDPEVFFLNIASGATKRK
jgi:hypothetical protein